MFRSLIAHSQEALYKRNLVYRVRVMSAAPGLEWPPENDQLML
jgi:hypothetical protein